MTQFWWVNQNETYEEESARGILWAPKFNRRGHKQSHWESLSRVEAGDVVFHYVRGAIRAVSVAEGPSFDAERPYRHELWSAEGRAVSVTSQELDVFLPFASLPSELLTSLPARNAPVSTAGRVNVGYLFDLTRESGLALLGAAGLTAGPPSPGESTESSAGDGDPRSFVFTEETDGTLVTTYRRERPQLRKFLFGTAHLDVCDLCGRRLPVQLLVTAHIKPRSRCTPQERCDGNVVFSACSLGCDALFEGGMLVVDQVGVVRAGRPIVGPTDLHEFIAALVGRTVGRFSSANSKYFNWHRRSHLTA